MSLRYILFLFYIDSKITHVLSNLSLIFGTKRHVKKTADLVYQLKVCSVIHKILKFLKNEMANDIIN